MSNALWNILLSISDVDGWENRLSMLSVSAEAMVFNNILLWLGVVVLFIWIITQMRESGKYRLKNVPLRRNNIFPASLVLLFMGWHLVSAAADWLLMKCGLPELQLKILAPMIGQIFAIPAAIIFAHYSIKSGVRRGL